MSEQIQPMSGGRIEMRVQRHDAHDKGHLTPEGQEHAKEVADEEVERYLDQSPDTHFMIIASDQVLDDREPEFGGIRAHETASIIADSIRSHLSERGLPEDQLFGFSDQDPLTNTPVIREANIFSNDFMQHLRSKYPDDNSWSLYYQDTDAETRRAMGAESPLDLAKRMDYMIKVAEMVGASFHKTPGKEDKPLMIWMVGHGGGIDSYLHHFAGVPIEELGFDLSGGFTLKAAPDGTVVADVKGKEYPIHRDESMNLPK
jgi:broad specificity phosphatase PhoE